MTTVEPSATDADMAYLRKWEESGEDYPLQFFRHVYGLRELLGAVSLSQDACKAVLESDTLQLWGPGGKLVDAIVGTGGGKWPSLVDVVQGYGHVSLHYASGLTVAVQRDILFSCLNLASLFPLQGGGGEAVPVGLFQGFAFGFLCHLFVQPRFVTRRGKRVESFTRKHVHKALRHLEIYVGALIPTLEVAMSEQGKRRADLLHAVTADEIGRFDTRSLEDLRLLGKQLVDYLVTKGTREMSNEQYAGIVGALVVLAMSCPADGEVLPVGRYYDIVYWVLLPFSCAPVV